MVNIINLRLQKPENPWDVRVDRSSVLGNPFKMKEESQRDEVCDKYDAYFAEQLRENPAVQKEIQRILALHQTHGELNLFCWCAPKRCHAETVRRHILQRLGLQS